MKVIQRRLILLTSSCLIVSLFSLLLFIKDFVICRIDMRAVFALSILISIILAVLFMQEYEIYNIANIIVENKIMYIRAAEIQQVSNDFRSFLCIDGLEIFISCFGILLGSKVIKFNIGRIKLNEVAIENNSIYIVYGTDTEIRIIRLVHGVIEKKELANIVNRFRYETGITPIVID